ncbi:MAG: sigma-54 factor interaction domain-containing protein, partial [Acidobacteriota bacterium]
MSSVEIELAKKLAAETRISGSTAEGVRPAEVEIPTLTVLAHPDRLRVGQTAGLSELSLGQAMELSRLAPRFSHPGRGGLEPLAEACLSRKPLRLTSEGPDLRLDRAGSATSVRVEGEVLEHSRCFRPADLERGVVLELGRRVVLLLHLQPALTPALPRFGMVGDSGAMIRLREEIQLAAKVDLPVLLRGASGTGKELVARALHDASERRDGPWVTVNMAAIPPALAAAELFGARRGAFTGAHRDKPGYFAAADGGTLFLDEVGDTPAEIQPLLLRALESGEIQSVGEAGASRVDVRVVAATDSNLEAAVQSGSFRAPLLHRLAGWEISLPTLAERRS